MISKSAVFVAFALLTITTVYLSSNLYQHKASLQSQQSEDNTLTFTFRSISSILRTTFSRIYTVNDTIYIGDNVGSVAIWNYDAKKKVLEYQDVSRQISATLPPQNKVITLEANAGGVVVLTEDGKLITYITNAQSKITSNLQITLQQPTSWFTLIKLTTNTTLVHTVQIPIIASINKNKSKLCIYSLKQSIVRPNPITKISCNSTSANISYDHIAFDPLNNLISVGDQNKVILFKLNITEQGKVQMKYLIQANLPKVEVKGFKSTFTNGTLLVINDLWLNSILIDQTVPSARVISAERTQRIIKQGLTTDLSAYLDAKTKKSLVFINSKDRVQSFTVSNNKLTYVNDSKAIGRCTNFLVRDQTELYAAVGDSLQVLKIGGDAKDYIQVQSQYSIQSANHFKPVKTLSMWNNTFLVTAADSSKFNVKLWNYSATNYKLTYTDEKSISFFSILKAGYVSFLSSLWIPPLAKSTTLHIAISGADPFGLYIIPVTPQGKFGAQFRSKDEHLNNVTGIFLSEDGKKILTTSMDSTAKIWTLTTNNNQVQDNTTTVVTKNGPIRLAVQDKNKTYYAFGHSSNVFNPQVNISIWKSDIKNGLVKLAQNVPGESQQYNLTGLVLSHDEKYLISLSEIGQLRLWRLQNWTMVDLMASLGLGIYDGSLQGTLTNKIIIQSEKLFAQYYFDQNGFILLGRFTKTFTSVVNSSLIDKNTWFSGDVDGSVRIYTFQQ